MHKPDPTHSPKQERDYSDRDIPVGKIVLFGLYIALFTVLTFIGARLLFSYFDRSNQRAQPVVSSFADQRVLPPEPRLLVDEPDVWQQQLVLAKAKLENYAWIDQKAGTVQIPVERAIELVAARGLPSRPVATP